MTMAVAARTVQDTKSRPTDALTPHARLVEALRAMRPFGHPVLRVEMIETHISTVLLAGDFAYKIKKPVDLGFVDFTTLEKRRQCCEGEVRLNRRTAPQLYLGVVPITGSIDCPVVDGEGAAIEYAVKMRRFASDATLDALLREGVLPPDQIDALAALVAVFHGSVPVAGLASGYGAPEVIWEAALDNFRQMRIRVDYPATVEKLARLRAWTEAEFQRLVPTFERRRQHGFVRECHGDLHLGNVALIDGSPVPFDCIEFSDSLRWIDVINEAAFTMMDLLAHGERELAFRFLNRYLEERGDYEGVALLRFYLVYRALVRAKIASIQRQSASLEGYLRLAETLVESARSGLVITCGLSGSGKTTVARTLAGSLGAVHIRSDVERKRLHGIAAQTRSTTAVDSGIYDAVSTAATYERMAEIVRVLLSCGFPIIVDATFLHRSQRNAFRDLARREGVRFVIVRCEAPLDVLRARLINRVDDASDATLAVLDRQLESREGFSPAEAESAVVCETTDSAKSAVALADVKARLAG